MVDTIRQLDDLLARMPVNSSGLISTQDVRDFLVSALPTGRGATKVVASAAASDLRKAQADYAGGGPDINAAIAAAGAGKVELTEGTFTIVNRVDADLAKLVITGQGPASIIKNGVGTTTPLIRLAADDVTVCFLALDGTRLTATDGYGIAHISGARPKFLYLHIRSVYKAGIYFLLGGLTDIDGEIAHCYLSDIGTHGLHIDNCQGMKIHHNTIETWGARVAENCGIEVSGSEEIEVFGNRVVGGGTLVVAKFPIQIKDSQDFEVLANRVRDSNDDGIMLSGVNNGVVGYNIIRNSQGPGISCTNAGDLNIGHNSVRVAVGNGIAVDATNGDIHDVEVEGNVVTSGLKVGIIVTSGAVQAISRVGIHHNIVRDHTQDVGGTLGFGIQITGNGVVADTIRVYKNILNGNRVDVQLKAGTHAKDNEGVTIPDPGNAGAISVIKGSGIVALVTAGAETRTLAAPSNVGQELTLNMVTDGGDCVVTCASGINAANNTVMTFAEIGDTIWLKAMEKGAGTFRWRVMGNDGVALS